MTDGHLRITLTQTKKCVRCTERKLNEVQFEVNDAYQGFASAMPSKQQSADRLYAARSRPRQPLQRSALPTTGARLKRRALIRILLTQQHHRCALPGAPYPLLR